MRGTFCPRIRPPRFTGVPGLRIPSVPAHLGHAWYKYYAYVASGRDGVLPPAPLWGRATAGAAALEKAGSPAFSGSCSEMYLEKAFEGPGLRPAERLPVARELGETSLMLLVHPTLSEEALDGVAAAVKAALGPCR